MRRIVVAVSSFAAIICLVLGFMTVPGAMAASANSKPTTATSKPPATSIKGSAPVNSGAQWMARIDTLRVCQQYDLSLWGPNGDYCMQINVPVQYNGVQVEITQSDFTSNISHVFRAGFCQAWALQPPDSPSNLPSWPTVKPKWCGLSGIQQWQDSWGYSGPSFPVRMQSESGDYQTVSQPAENNAPVSAIYLGMNIQADVPVLNDPILGGLGLLLGFTDAFGGAQISTYPWMRGTIDAFGNLTCASQAAPALKRDTSGDGCPPGSVTESEPVPLGVSTNPASTAAPPSAAAIAAWKATVSDTPNTVGAALRGVGSLLAPSDATQIAELNQLSAIPLADLAKDPPAQIVQGQKDIVALDFFFNTKGLVPASGAPAATTTPPPPVNPGEPSVTPTGPPPAALAAWKATAGVPAVMLGAALMRVASLLPASDSSEIAELQQLASLPPTGDTPAQMAEAQKDVSDLNFFFGTPGFTPGG